MTIRMPYGFRETDLLIHFDSQNQCALEGARTLPAARLCWEATDMDALFGAFARIQEVDRARAESAQHLGRALAALLPDVHRTTILEWLVERRGRLVLQSAGSGVGALPWELLDLGQVGASRQPVLDRSCELVRVFPAVDGEAPPVRWLPTPGVDRFKVLVVVGDAQGALDVHQHAQEIDRVLARLGERVERTVLAPGGVLRLGEGTGREVDPYENREDVLRALREGFDIVHYVGHGIGDKVTADCSTVESSALSLDCASKDERLLDPHVIVEALAATGRTRLFIANACRSGPYLAQRLSRAVPHVITMQAFVTDLATARFARVIYERLLDLDSPAPPGHAIATWRVEADEQEKWVPAHFARRLDEIPFLDPGSLALEHYLQAVRRAHASVENDLFASFRSDAPLEELYVELHFEPDNDQARGLWHEVSHDGPPTLPRLLDVSTERGPLHWTLLGAPGAGKSTTLRWMARWLAREDRREGGKVPIFLTLPSWPIEGEGDSARLVPWQEALEHRYSKRPWSLGLIGRLEELALDGRLVFLLDGFDECSNRSAVKRYFADGPGIPARNAIVIASRTLGYAEVELPDFKAVRLRELDPGQQQRLLERWFEAEIRRTGAGEEASRVLGRDSREVASELRNSLTGNARRLARTPLFLLLWALVWREGGPDALGSDLSRGQFLELVLDYLIKCRHRPLGQRPTPPFPGFSRAVRTLMQRIAFEATWEEARTPPQEGSLTASRVRGWAMQKTHEGGLGDWLRQHVPTDVQKLLDEQWSSDLAKIEDLDALLNDHIPNITGLLRKSDTGDYSFPHRSLREALVAELMRDVYRRVAANDRPSALPALQAFAQIIASSYADRRGYNPIDDQWGEPFVHVVGWIDDVHDRLAWVEFLIGLEWPLAKRVLLHADGLYPEQRVRFVSLMEWPMGRGQLYEGLVEVETNPSAALGLVQSATETDTYRRNLYDRACLHYLAEIVGRRQASLSRRVAMVRQKTRDGLLHGSDEKLARLFTRMPDLWESGVGDRLLWREVPPDPTFVMGSPRTDPSRRANGRRITRPILARFWIARVPVTIAQYRLFDPQKTWLWADRDDLPAHGVSWYEAMLFCEFLSCKLYGRPDVLRLPEEWEWEYACRGASGHQALKPMSAGSFEELSELAWFRENSDNRVQPVGTRRPNSLGLFDMQGNVDEWCRSRYLEDDLLTSTAFVQRGGCYWNAPDQCRVTNRDCNGPWNNNWENGFRLVLTAPPKFGGS